MKKRVSLPSFRIVLLALLAACSGGGGGDGTPPSFTGYTEDPAVYRAGSSVVSNAPVVTGAATSWSITPALPAGLSLDTATGLISGTPTGPSVPTVYEVGASNGAGTTTRQLHMLVTTGEDGYVVTVNGLDNTASAYVLRNDVMVHNGYLPVGLSPQDAAVAPYGRAVVIPNALSDNVSVLIVDETSGRLSAAPGSPFATGSEPTDAAVSATGDYAYVLAAAGGTSGSIRQYSLNETTGALSPLSPSSIGAGDDLVDIACAVDGGQVYALATGTTSEVRTFHVNSDGTLTAAGMVNAGPNSAALALNSFGEFLYVANGNGTISGYARDTDSGLLTALAGSPFAGTLASYSHLTLSLDALTLFAVSATGSVDSFAVDFHGDVTGVAGAPHDPVAFPVDSGLGASQLALGGRGGLLFVTNTATSEVSALDIGSGGTLAPNIPPHSMARSGSTASCVIGRATPVEFTADALYAANRGANDVSQFDRALDGTLVALTAPTVATGNTPVWAEVHPSLDVLYLANQLDTTSAIEVFGLAADGSATTLQDVAETNAGVWSIVVEPSGRFAYSTHTGDSTLLSYSVGNDGSLTAMGTPLATGATPRGIAIHPAGSFLYVANSLSNTISMYSIAPMTGAIAALAPATITTGTTPISLTFDATGEFLYCTNAGTDNSLSLYSCDPATGQLTELTSSPYAFPANSDPFDIVAHPGGRLLFAGLQGDSTVRGLLINRNTGNATEDGAVGLIATESLPGQPSKLRISPDGTTLHIAVEKTVGTVDTYTIPGASGLLVFLESVASGPLTRALALRSRVQ